MRISTILVALVALAATGCIAAVVGGAAGVASNKHKDHKEEAGLRQEVLFLQNAARMGLEMTPAELDEWTAWLLGELQYEPAPCPPGVGAGLGAALRLTCASLAPDPPPPAPANDRRVSERFEDLEGSSRAVSRLLPWRRWTEGALHSSFVIDNRQVLRVLRLGLDRGQMLVMSFAKWENPRVKGSLEESG